MLPITYYLIGNPFIALGLAILVLVCIYNILRRQVRVAAGLWLLIIVVLLYSYVQALNERSGTADETGHEGLPAEAVQN